MRLIPFCIVFLFVIQTIKAQPGDSVKKGPTAVLIDGLVDSSFSISNANLNAFKIIEGGNLNIRGPKGETKGTINSFKGILLTDILSKAKVSLQKEKDRGEFIILITAADGYKVSFSYNELMFSAAGKNTYLLFEEDGAPIDKKGPFVVVCTSDPITGPRHVKWVKEITVKKIN